MSKDFVTLQNDLLSVAISLKGAELTSIKKDGKERLWQGNPDLWSAQAPVLFPFCGCLKEGCYQFEGKGYEMPKHGFARLSHFIIEKQTESEVILRLDANEETKKLYPFDFSFRVKYALEENSLIVSYAAKNTGSKTLYFSLGGHEGHACPGGISGCALVFDRPETLDSALLSGPFLTRQTKNLGKNTTELILNDELFTLNTLIFQGLSSETVTLKNPSGKTLVKLNFKEAETLAVWTIPGAEFLCLEPWNGLPDFVDSTGELTEKTGIMKLLPHETCEKTHILSY